MNLPKSDLATLLSERLAPAPDIAFASVVSDSTGSPGGSLPTAPLSVEFLRACSRTLWQRVGKSPLSKKDARNKMLELIEWLSRKQGWMFKPNVSQEYRYHGSVVDGRVHAQAQSGAKTVVLEVCFDLQEPILFKLWSAYVQGKQVLLLWVGPPMPDTVFAGRLSALFKGQPVGWLRFVQLKKSD